MPPISSPDVRPAQHRRRRLSVAWAVGLLVAAAGVFAIDLFTRPERSPVWLVFTLAYVPPVLGLLAVVIFVFGLSRDWLVSIDPLAGGTTRRRHPLRDAIRLGSPAWALCFAVVAGAGYSLSQTNGFSPWLRVLCALSPLVPLAMYLRSIYREQATVDELALLIRREAFSFVFCAMLGILVCVHLLEKAGVIPGFTWDSMRIVGLMLVLLIVGAVISSRHFR